MSIAYYVNPRIRAQFKEATARRAAAAVLVNDWPDRHLSAIRRTWADAVKDVPYYSDLVARGEAPAAIRDWRDVMALPVLTRQAIQDEPARFVRRSGPPRDRISTAGSTGTPLRLGMGSAERDLMRVVKLAEWQAQGYGAGSRLFLLWGHSHLLGTGWKGRLNHLKRRLGDAYLGYRRVDAYRLGPERSAAYAEALMAFRPAGVIGYASALDLFARQASRFRSRFRALGVRFVLATAEAPPRPDTVPLLEDLFGCPVVQEYGGAEFGQVAFKRGPAPFEVYPDLNYVEVEPPDAEGPAGERPLLLTSLYPRYVPLVRYRAGDSLVGPTCLANGHVSRFDAVGGRVNDVIALPDGEAIHSVAIFHCIHQEPGVYNIQMVVRESGIDIRLVAAREGRPAMETRIRARLRQVHPALEDARFEYVEDLPTTRAGKRRWFVDERTNSSCAASPAS